MPVATGKPPWRPLLSTCRKTPRRTASQGFRQDPHSLGVSPPLIRVSYADDVKSAGIEDQRQEVGRAMGSLHWGNRMKTRRGREDVHAMELMVRR